MESDKAPLVDPEVRAFIFSLVSATGGPSGSDDGRYVLGDDALAVLKDIKRWILLVDNKANSLVVSRLLAEANFVKGDLLEILASTPETCQEGSYRAKIAIHAVDLLTQVTWPVDKPEKDMRMDHFTHIPFLEAAQASYKRAILHHDAAAILRLVVRAALPAIAQPRKERRPNDDMIIKVVLYLFRNLIMIEKGQLTAYGEQDEEISRSATIDALHRQDVFDLFLTLGSSLLEEYETHDVELLEILFHLVKGIDVDTLFMDRDELMSAQTRDLKCLIGKEKHMLASHQRHAPTRHTRFVPMMWMQREDGKRHTVIGQRAYMNDEVIIDEMDKNKKWRKPRRPRKHAPGPVAETFDAQVPLTSSARRHLRRFVQLFLDSSFNPLFTSLRRAMEREVERVEERHRRQYFYIISWFLRAESVRRKKAAAESNQSPAEEPGNVESFALVASVLNQGTFALLNRSMQTSNDERDWQDLNAEMRCFTQILSTVHEMTESPLEEDQDIAENILSRLFYEQSTHDRIIAILRTYKDQGFGYLDACTELSHTFLRVLERYSKGNVDMQVRRIRRVRKKKDEAEGNTETEGENAANREMDRQEAERVSSERRFDFPKYAARFINQSSVDTFVAFTKFYKELNDEQLKRAHRFFHRVAFKMELSPYLFRADIILLFQRLVKGPGGLDPENRMFKDWEELARQVFRRLVKKMQERPCLGVEFLFSKIPRTVYFLEHGYDLTPVRRFTRPPAEIEVKPGMERNEQLQVAVSALINMSKSDIISWIKAKISQVLETRQLWQEADSAQREVARAQAEAARAERETDDAEIEPNAEENRSEVDTSGKLPDPVTIRHDSEETRIALQRDKHVRLLLKLLDFSCEDYLEVTPPYAEWVIPGSIPSARLKADLDLISRTEFAPPTYDDGKSAEDFLRRKYVSSGRTQQPNDGASASDSEGGSIASDIEEGLFVADKPTDVPEDARAPKGEKKKRRIRNRHEKDEHLDERGLEERRKARQRMERERANKIKSQLFISPSDDESDEERDRKFFELEARLRNQTAKKVVQAQKEAAVEIQEKTATRKTGSRKRKSDHVEPESRTEGSDADSVASPAPRTKKSRLAQLLDGSDDDDEEDQGGLWSDEEEAEMTDDPGSTSDAGARTARRTPNMPFDDSDSEADSDRSTPPSSERPSLGQDPTAGMTHDDDAAMSDDAAGNAIAGDSDKENQGAPSLSGMPAKRRQLKIVDDDEDE